MVKNKKFSNWGKKCQIQKENILLIVGIAEDLQIQK